jgi:hypothetical protein
VDLPLIAIAVMVVAGRAIRTRRRLDRRRRRAYRSIRRGDGRFIQLWILRRVRRACGDRGPRCGPGSDAVVRVTWSRRRPGTVMARGAKAAAVRSCVHMRCSRQNTPPAMTGPPSAPRPHALMWPPTHFKRLCLHHLLLRRLPLRLTAPSGAHGWTTARAAGHSGRSSWEWGSTA